MTSSDCRASKIIWHDTKLEPISWVLNIENRLFSICVGVWVGGHHATNFSHISKDAQENFVSFDTNVVVVGDGANMVLNGKPTKNLKLRGLKLRGLTWNQINTPYFIYEIDQREKLNNLGDFENQKPTHIDATYAFSKFPKNFQNRIPRELNQNLYTSGIGINHWISSIFLN